METYDVIGDGMFLAFPQPLTQDDATLNIPQKEPFTSQKQPTGADWEKYRPIITDLYMKEKRTLKEVMAIMSTRHNFKATQRMYKKRISDWDIRRHLRWAEREALCQDIQQGQLSGPKNATVVVRGQERHLALFLRHMRQKRRMRKGNTRSGMVDSGPDEIEVIVDNPSSPKEIMQHIWAMSTEVGPSLDSVGDERTCEIICHSTMVMWQESSSIIASPTFDLYQFLDLAEEMAGQRKYRDSRVLVNRAGNLYHKELRCNPAFALLSVLEGTLVPERPKLLHFDPIAIFSTHALDLTMVLYGPNHPATVALSHLSNLKETVATAIPAFQASITTIMAKSTSLVALHTVQTLRLHLANFFELSGCLLEVKNIRLDLVENFTEPDVHGLNKRSLALADLAWHYLYHETDGFDKAERLFSQIYDEGIDSLTGEVDPCSAYSAYAGLGKIAYQRNNLKETEWYYTKRIYVARQACGEDHIAVLESTEMLAEFLEDQERYDEAEEIRNSFQLVDDMEGMS